MNKSYSETLDFLYSRLPVFQHIGKAAYKADLNNTIALCRAFGNPEQDLPCIHVAGTNGKGSVSSFLAAIFSEHGYKTGLYTSPHLIDFRERIRINGEMISEKEVMDFTTQAEPFIESIKPSFFELTVAMAFDHFKKHKVDIAIIETGMGGRLDSTNVIVPKLSVITNIGFDHTDFLGDTLALIAGEKAGIIKANIPVVVGETVAETLPVFVDKAREMHSDIAFAQDCPEEWKKACPLKGSYQEKNLATVYKAIEVLEKQENYSFSPPKLLSAIANVKKWSGLRGRWEVIGHEPYIVADTAHNEHGLKLTMEQVLATNPDTLHMVLGVVNDKDLSKILPLFPKTAQYYFCKPAIFRGLEAAILKENAANHGLIGQVWPSVATALQAAKNAASSKDTIYVGGSTFVVAEALN